jgi:hypothetical protein
MPLGRGQHIWEALHHNHRASMPKSGVSPSPHEANNPFPRVSTLLGFGQLFVAALHYNSRVGTPKIAWARTP